MELQCNSFKLLSFIDVFRRNEFSSKQALSNSFYLTLLPIFKLYWRNGIQTNAGHNNTQYALTTNLACIFL